MRVLLNKFRDIGRKFSSSAAAAPASYSGSVQFFHWAMGTSVIACVGLVQVAMSYKPGEKIKDQLMFYHKSFGLLAAGLLGPRIISRLISKSPAPMEGHKIIQLGADLSHFLLYGFMIALPATGIAMGYFGGKGLPFFYTTVPGAPKPDGAIAKQAFQIHKQAGNIFKYLIPVHMGGAFFHVAQGQKIFGRILPIGKAAPK